jgi:hypothetical protein
MAPWQQSLSLLCPKETRESNGWEKKPHKKTTIHFVQSPSIHTAVDLNYTQDRDMRGADEMGWNFS